MDKTSWLDWTFSHPPVTYTEIRNSFGTLLRYLEGDKNGPSGHLPSNLEMSTARWCGHLKERSHYRRQKFNCSFGCNWTRSGNGLTLQRGKCIRTGLWRDRHNCEILKEELWWAHVGWNHVKRLTTVGLNLYTGNGSNLNCTSFATAKWRDQIRLMQNTSLWSACDSLLPATG